MGRRCLNMWDIRAPVLSCCDIGEKNMNEYTLLVGLILFALGFGIAFWTRKMTTSKKATAVKEEAHQMLADAKRQSENVVKEAELEAKDRFLKMKGEFDKETKETRHDIKKREKRLNKKEEKVERKIELIDQRIKEIERTEKDLNQRGEKIKTDEKRYGELVREQKAQLEKISGLTTEQAKDLLIRAMENEARYEAAKMVKRIETEAAETSDKTAKKIISTAIQRYAADFVAERTVSVVPLPSDEMKGRIIGREGRNIRALEAATGIDLIIDDTPEAVILSGFNPVRREVARLSLMRLIADGRIHPARIETIVKKVAGEVDLTIKEAGEQAAFDLGVHGLDSELIKTIGCLKFRTSYAQNVLQHSVEVGFLTGIMASELGLSTKLARRMGLLHDIGKAVDHEVEGPHALIGSNMAKKYNESSKVVHAIAAHHEDIPPASVYALLVQAADGLSGARPGARKERLENYIKRLDDLETIANSFHGVENSYVIQAGREVRVMVESDKINDEESVLLSKDIVKKIEEKLTFPGQIRITVIRETRAVEYANK